MKYTCVNCAGCGRTGRSKSARETCPFVVHVGGVRVTFPSESTTERPATPISETSPGKSYFKAVMESIENRHEVARFYSLGGKDVVDCNDEEKFKWYWEAASQGHVESMRRVADRFYYGSEVSNDSDVARLWYARAAKAGDDVSLDMLKDHWELDGDDLHRLYGIINEIPVGMNCKADDAEK